MQPKVSIIMPTYKGFELIDKSIQSVLEQSYKNIELIIVDDNGKGSEAQVLTENIIKPFMTDSRLHYICHKLNKNGSAARNTGIRAATGKYIAFLDDDDCFINDKIERQVELFEKLPEQYGLVYGGLVECFPDGRKKEIFPRETDDFLFEYLAGNLYVCSSTIMISRVAIDAIGMWDESFNRHQDMEYISRVAEKYKVAFINEPCIMKIRVDRNLPQDGKKCEEYRLHYLSKMEHLIKHYNYKEQQEIYFFHYLSIGKNYIKNKKIWLPLKYAFKSGKPLNMFSQYLCDAAKYFRKWIFRETF